MKGHFRKIAHMDLVGRLPAPAHFLDRWLEPIQKKHSLLVGANQEIDPDIGSTRVRVQITDPGGASKIAAPINQAALGEDESASSAYDNDKCAVRKSPPGPEFGVPVNSPNPLAVRFNHFHKPGKMN